MTPATLHRIYLGAIGLLLLAGGFLWFRASERHAGAIAVLTHQADSTVTAIAKDTARIAQEARQKEADAQGLLDKARAQIARQRADSAKQDSIVRASANERANAERVLRDSLATVGALRSELGRMLAQSRVDSGAAKQAASEAARTVGSLLSVIAADSAALTAERARSASLTALAASLQAEVRLLRESQPSGVGKVIWAIAGGGVGYFAGRAGVK